jgi:hypothetical protein
MAIAGIAGRVRLCDPAPTSMDRVTTTAGEPAAAEAAGAGAAAGADTAAWVVVDDVRVVPEVGAGFAAGCCGADAGLPGVACEAGARCAALVDGGPPFCPCGVAGCCGAGAPRPSFGGLCIDGSSSVVLVDVASVSPFGLPEKSLEKTLIAEHQP